MRYKTGHNLSKWGLTTAKYSGQWLLMTGTLMPLLMHPSFVLAACCLQLQHTAGSCSVCGPLGHLDYFFACCCQAMSSCSCECCSLTCPLSPEQRLLFLLLASNRMGQWVVPGRRSSHHVQRVQWRKGEVARKAHWRRFIQCWHWGHCCSGLPSLCSGQR